MLQPEIDKKHQRITVSKEIRYPYIFFDETRLIEIILNLISNAIKYTGENGTIACSIRQIPDAEEGWVTQEFTVTDHGIEGTGLGMGIVKKLVDMMNGEIKKVRKGS